MTLRPAGRPRIERLPTTDSGPDCGHPFVSSVPRVDVRVVLFKVNTGHLMVALQEQTTRSALPRGSPTLVESLDAAGTRKLANHVGIAERYLEQLNSISHNSEGHWTVTITYFALALAGDGEPRLNTAAWSYIGILPDVDPVHRKIVDHALLRLRAKLGYTTNAFHLLPPSFSPRDLQIDYESVLNHEVDNEVDNRNFRRRILAAGVPEGTGFSGREGSHRPAGLFRFRAGGNGETFLTPGWAFGMEQGVTNP